ncbi:hypothetical protein BM536_036360 [Streptomyces phaeoluteigriseus]|uniref:Uncharacterized protein n=1 Tax=Streptomyces phaeoluteigriseus TaxID=114686 RepID=A0A1V6MHY8_9ACTN|nr:hypothetical protein BM536_036360 [Streptomyces phaeoluteigriseus]
MADLVHDPRPVSADVARAFRIALRRPYRIRNIIRHGGATQGVALEASLRTAAPLVGAGLDRIGLALPFCRSVRRNGPSPPTHPCG